MSREPIVATREDDLEIARFGGGRQAALKAKEVGGLTDGYARDALLFDVKPPFPLRGPKSIRAIWEGYLPCLPARFEPQSGRGVLLRDPDAETSAA